MESSRRIIYSRIIFITGIVLLTSLSILFLYETFEESTSSDVVHNTQITRQSLERTYSALKDHESALRGYALVRDTVYLLKQTSTTKIDKHLALVDSLISGDSAQINRLKKLKSLITFQIRHQDSVIQRLQNRD